MSQEFNNAVLDTLLPGDAILPAASRSGIDAASVVAVHTPIFTTIAKAAGGETAFVAQAPEARTALLREVDRGPDGVAFKAMVAAALHDYYTSDTVVAALGWRQGAPQPAGHKLAATDDTTRQRLEKVKRRSRLWR